MMKTASKDTQRVVHELPARTLLKVGVAIGALWLLTRLWPILLIITFALILVGTLSPIVAAVERRGLRRTWAVAVVFVGLSAIVVVIGLVTVPALVTQLLELIQHAPQLQSRLAGVLSHNRLTAPLSASIEHFQLDKLLTGNAASTLEYSGRAVVTIGYAMTSVVLALYIVADRDRARGALYAWVPRAYHVRLARILLNLETIVGGYMRGQVITSVAIAVFAFTLLTICRVPHALALATFAGITDVVPFIGGLMATTPAVLAALSRGVGVALIVLVTFIAYQEFESRVLVPRIYGRALRLSSAVVIVALLAGGMLLGIVGALLALPLAAGIRMMIEELRVDRPGDDTDDSELRARDEEAEQRYEARSAGAAPEEAAAVAGEIADEIRREDAADPREAAEVPVTGGAK